ncbi:WD40 repeat domain-containing protein [Streptomyces sp. NPDC005408]|uniref:WD40 repeat domain-containing protein n=1 Tax=Streptomyces sp. NPDC005408 TaxID=3155341 RepID=UPI0033A1ABBD
MSLESTKPNNSVWRGAYWTGDSPPVSSPAAPHPRLERAQAAPLGEASSEHTAIDALDCSPDGRTLVSGGSDVLRLRDLSDPKRPKALKPLTGYTGPVDAMVFSPDGRTLATGTTRSGCGTSPTRSITTSVRVLAGRFRPGPRRPCRGCPPRLGRRAGEIREVEDSQEPAMVAVWPTHVAADHQADTAHPAPKPTQRSPTRRRTAGRRRAGACPACPSLT